MIHLLSPQSAKYFCMSRGFWKKARSGILLYSLASSHPGWPLQPRHHLASLPCPVELYDMVNDGTSNLVSICHAIAQGAPDSIDNSQMTAAVRLTTRTRLLLVSHLIPVGLRVCFSRTLFKIWKQSALMFSGKALNHKHVGTLMAIQPRLSSCSCWIVRLTSRRNFYMSYTQTRSSFLSGGKPTPDQLLSPEIAKDSGNDVC